MINWNIVADLYNIVLTMFFLVISILMFIIAYKGAKHNRYGSRSTALCGFFFVFFGIYNHFFRFLPYPLNGIFVWWIGIVIIVFLGFGLCVRKTTRKLDQKTANESPKELTSFQKMINEVRKKEAYKAQIPLKMEYLRKSFHLAGLLFIFVYFGFIIIPPLSILVNDAIINLIKNSEWFYNILWGNTNSYPFSYGDTQAIDYITMFALLGAFVIMIISDLIRVLWGNEYSIFNFLTKSVLRNEEYNAVGPQIYLITGAIFSYLLYIIGIVDILAVSAGILIACFSDALAAIIGRKYGKKKVRCLSGNHKTIEGFIAGTGSAYLIGLFTIGPLYAFFASLIFLILDYSLRFIADNILNPILITIGITFFQMIIGIPLGLLI